MLVTTSTSYFRGSARNPRPSSGTKRIRCYSQRMHHIPVILTNILKTEALIWSIGLLDGLLTFLRAQGPASQQSCRVLRSHACQVLAKRYLVQSNCGLNVPRVAAYGCIDTSRDLARQNLLHRLAKLSFAYKHARHPLSCLTYTVTSSYENCETVNAPVASTLGRSISRPILNIYAI